jgi:hypothetical protein
MLSRRRYVICRLQLCDPYKENCIYFIFRGNRKSMGNLGKFLGKMVIFGDFRKFLSKFMNFRIFVLTFCCRLFILYAGVSVDGSFFWLSGVGCRMLMVDCWCRCRYDFREFLTKFVNFSIFVLIFCCRLFNVYFVCGCIR